MSSARKTLCLPGVGDYRRADPVAGSPVAADRPNFSKQIIAHLGLAATEANVIPTTGISIGTTQYVNFMSVRQWG